MGKTKIEWSDYTWNPVTGCLHNCEYCYARVFTKRFSGDVRLNYADEQTIKDDKGRFILEKPFVAQSGGILSFPFEFAPTLHKYRLQDPANWKSGQNIFVCSMADLFGEWVPDEWIVQILEIAKANPQHNYLFLTKNPNRYVSLAEKGVLPKGDNFWYGSTATDPSMSVFFSNVYHTFVSIEPILEPFGEPREPSEFLENVDWVILGAETGNRKNKVTPQAEWINNITDKCYKHHIPVFMKDSLISIVGEENMRREYPKELHRHVLSEYNKQRWVTVCSSCGKEYAKKKMTAILTRRARGETAKALGYICDDCIDDFRRMFK